MNLTAFDGQLKVKNEAMAVLPDLWENMRTGSMSAKSTMENICTARHQCITAFCQLSTSNAKLRSHGREESAITAFISWKHVNRLFAGAPVWFPGSWKMRFWDEVAHTESHIDHEKGHQSTATQLGVKQKACGIIS